MEQYAQIAEAHGLDPAQMALAFLLRQPFLTSAIVGATTPEQLRTNLASIDLALPGGGGRGHRGRAQRGSEPMPVTLDLYGHPWSAPTREVRILCAELGVDYRFIEVKQAEAGDYLPEALNPACKVPMIDAAASSWARRTPSCAIWRRVTTRPASGTRRRSMSRAKVDQWLDWQALRLGRLAAQLMRERRFRPDAPDAAACAEAERLLGLILPELDMELKATPFVCGQHPTLADIAIFTSVDYLRLAGFDVERLAASPLVQHLRRTSSLGGHRTCAAICVSEGGCSAGLSVRRAPFAPLCGP